MEDTTAIDQRLTGMGHEFQRLTGHTAYLRSETFSSGTTYWRFIDDMFTDSRRALVHMESLLQIARQGQAGELLWWTGGAVEGR